MRAALVVFQVASQRARNLRAMLAGVADAARAGADLVLFPEAALTGLVNDDNPEHDLRLGEPIPGPVTDALARGAAAHGVYVAAGLLERDGDCLYDSALLLDPAGKLVLHYRRIQPQWHGRNADPAVYREGDEIVAADTPLGRIVFLVCGDLFDDGIVARARALAPDCALFPFARSFDGGSFDQARWDREEEPEYVTRAALLGCAMLMVNELSDPANTPWPAFGGALAVSREGGIIARHPIASPGMLLVDV